MKGLMMKKILIFTYRIFTYVLILAAVVMMIFTIISVNTFDRNDRALFGYKAYIVRSDSMSTTNGDKENGYFNAGDLILVKEVDPETLNAGDIISYSSVNSENYGETVTHMIRSRTVDDEGSPGFVTYGTDTDMDDENVVTYAYVLGKYEKHLPGVGIFFQFLKTVPGYILCIFLPFLLLILVQGINSIRLFRKYKSEQLAELEEQREKERAEIEAERAELSRERKKQDELMKKLLAVQAMMQNQMDAVNNNKSDSSKSNSGNTDDII